ncbi:MAG: hypothetical protein PF795_08105 [Kiritimatiellae bacterium]|jgi:hypothetical protein|nr:hypothetical protein [Kiritimatiellia bacterium]
MAREDFLYTGEDGFLREHYGILKRKTLIDLAGEDGLISTRDSGAVRKLCEQFGASSLFGSQNLSDMVDWPPPGGFGPDTMGKRTAMCSER